MSSFCDKAGRDWNLAVDALLIDKIREGTDTKFLLNDSDADNTATRIGNDPVLLCHVVYMLCEQQRNERGISLESFYRDVIGSGESIQAAGEAVEQALANFIHPRQRPLAAAISAKRRSIEDKATAAALARINDPTLEAQIMATVEATLDNAINQALMGLSNATGSPGSAESAPPA